MRFEAAKQRWATHDGSSGAVSRQTGGKARQVVEQGVRMMADGKPSLGMGKMDVRARRSSRVDMVEEIRSPGAGGVQEAKLGSGEEVAHDWQMRVGCHGRGFGVGG